MSKIIITLISLFFSFMTIIAQENESIPESRKPITLLSEFDHEILNPYLLNSEDIKFIHKIILPNHSFALNLDSKNLKMNSFTTDISKKKINKRFYINGYSQQVIYTGAGSYYNLGYSLKWKPSAKISIEGGQFFSRQYGFLNSLRNDLWGANFFFTYNITKQLQLNYWAQYTTLNKDIFLDSNSLFPKKTMGASLLYKIIKNTKIGPSTEYYYNDVNKIWKSETKSSISIGF